MNICHILSFAVLVTSFSCLVAISPVSETDIDNSVDGDESVMYPIPQKNMSNSSASGDLQDDSWYCGFEWVEVLGPDGDSILIEVPLICDPLPYVYKGYPAPADFFDNELMKQY